MKNTIYFISTISLTLLLCFLSFEFCYFIAEKYFFDKFFYQKSIAHGYAVKNNPNRHLDYGDREKDLIPLEQNIKNILGTADDNTHFNIVIIGDSYVWGQGLRNNQRFSALLSEKLNTIRPTKITSLGKQGWNILNYQSTFQQINKYVKPDLIIFSMVTNDIYFNIQDQNTATAQYCSRIYPDTSAIYESNFNNFASDKTRSEQSIIYEQGLENAMNNPINQCIFTLTLKSLPDEKSIYFITEDYDKNWYRTTGFRKLVSNNNKYTLSSSKGENNPKYKKYWENGNIWKYFKISDLEGHPSILANQIFAEVLFTEITTNPKWEFVK